MKTCQTCKFWTNNIHENQFENHNMKECVSKKITENDENDKEFRISNKEDMLIYQYYEGGHFFTGKNFGCVHHKEESKSE